MLDIFMRIKTVDIDSVYGREHPPSPEMEGKFVRITNMDTVPDGDGMWKYDSHRPYQIFSGILVDSNGEDLEGGEVELIDHEIDSYENMPLIFSGFENAEEDPS